MSLAAAVLLYALCGYLLYQNAGFYDRSVLTLALGFAATLGVMALDRGTRAATLRRLAVVVHLLFSIVVLIDGPLSPRHGAFSPILWAADITCLLAVPLAGLAMFDPLPPYAERWFRALAIATVVLLAAQIVLVPTARPSPEIDVWVNNTKATSVFLKGIDPYSLVYRDVNFGEYDYPAGFLYFPGALFLYAPIRLIGGDIRYAHVAAILVTAAGFFVLARQRQAPVPQQWAVAILSMSFPVTALVLEFSWLDPLLLPFVVWAAVAMDRGEWGHAGLLLGLGFAIKQYTFVAIGPAAILAFRQEGWRAAGRLVAAVAIAFSVIVLPFALPDWRGFYNSTIGAHLNASVRRDGYTLVVYFYRQYGWMMSTGLRTAVTVAGGFAALAWIGFARTATLRIWAAATTLAFGIATIFGKFGFANYYYLLALYVLLYVTCAVGPSSSTPQQQISQ